MKIRNLNGMTFGELERLIMTTEYVRVVFRCDPELKIATRATGYGISEYTDGNMTVAAFIDDLREIVGTAVPIALVSPKGILPHGQTMIKNVRFGKPDKRATRQSLREFLSTPKLGGK